MIFRQHCTQHRGEKSESESTFLSPPLTEVTVLIPETTLTRMALEKPESAGESSWEFTKDAGFLSRLVS